MTVRWGHDFYTSRFSGARSPPISPSSSPPGSTLIAKALDRGDTVDALMENRHRFLLGLGVEIFQSTASEKAEVYSFLRSD